MVLSRFHGFAQNFFKKLEQKWWLHYPCVPQRHGSRADVFSGHPVSIELTVHKASVVLKRGDVLVGWIELYSALS